MIIGKAQPARYPQARTADAIEILFEEMDELRDLLELWD